MSKHHKFLYLIILGCLFSSCASIDYTKEPKKLYIGDGSVYVATASIFNKLSSGKLINSEYFYKNVPKDSLPRIFCRIFIKDLPTIWSKMGFNIEIVNVRNLKELQKFSNSNKGIIIIYEKTSLFGLSNYLHAAVIEKTEYWNDGSYKIDCIDSEGKFTIGMGYLSELHFIIGYCLEIKK